MARASEAPRRSFRYQPISKENLKARANAKSGDYDSVIKPQYKIYKMRDGKNLVRILPPTWEDPAHYAFDLHINYSIGVDNQAYLSLSKMKGEKDPLAEAKREADHGGDKKLSKALQPRKRPAMWIIDRQDEDEGPQILLCPMTLDTAIVNLSFDPDTREVTDIIDPENGCDVRFFKEGSGLMTDYDGAKIRILKPSPLHEDQAVMDDWLEYVQENPIPECLQFYDYDHIATVFDGHAGREEEPEAETPARRPAARKPADDNDPPFEPSNRRRPAAAPAEEVDEETGEITPQRPKVRDRSDPEGGTPGRGDMPHYEKEAPRPSIRERLAARGRKPAQDPDEE